MLQTLADGWFSFAGGRRWRCRAPGYFCEVQDPGNCPSFVSEAGALERVRRIRAFYAGRLQFGALDQSGTALDILVANAMTESFGTVPSPLDIRTLEQSLASRPDFPLDVRLDEMLRDIGANKATRWLVRREPNYVGPIATPAKVSVGAHQMLLSTANDLPSQRKLPGTLTERIRNQVVRLAADSLHSAQRAIEYLNGKRALHDNHLPLLAATYNAGSPRATETNPWHLVQYGEHIDRWIGYYNTSRRAVNQPLPSIIKAEIPAPEPIHTAGHTAGSPVRLISPATPGMEDTLFVHFKLAEFAASAIAREKGISNIPPPVVVQNLGRLASLLQQVRSLLGDLPIKITSGYRSPELNKAVGSKPTSMHIFGLAADFVCSSFGPPLRICRAIAASALQFDQVIHEFGRWVHIGLAHPGAPNRRQQLTIDSAGTHVGLLPIAEDIATASHKTTT